MIAYAYDVDFIELREKQIWNLSRCSASSWTTALCGGMPYEESMKSVAEHVTKEARDAIKEQFLSNVTIMKKGVPYTPRRKNVFLKDRNGEG